MKFRIYIDEVGNHDLRSAELPNERFLSLTGVIFDIDYIKSVHSEIEKLKTDFFDHHPDDPVIFHRKEMMNAQGPFRKLSDPTVRAKFDEQILNLFSKWSYAVITVCIDKRGHKEMYQVWKYDPYHYCLAVVLERYIMYLKHKNATGDVMIESRGGNEDFRLKKSFEYLWSNGTDFIKKEEFQTSLTSKQLKVKPKKNNIAGLQIADLLAYPSRNEILKENGLIENISPFANQIISILNTKYYRGRSKVFGKKLLSH